MKRLLTLIIMLMTLISAPMFAYEAISSANNVILTVDPRKNLQCKVRIPQVFSLYNYAPGATIYSHEYIQGGETWENWTEHICVSEGTHDRGAVLTDFLAHLEAGYHQRQNKKLIECHSTTHKECGVLVGVLFAETSGELVVVQDPPGEVSGQAVEAIPNTNEIVLTKIIEGKNNMVIIQYTKKYPVDKTTPEEKANMKEKMLGFLKSCRVTDH